ncbi:DUF6776 family protein [Pseudomaricurvus alcaniphilus]|uniref:DUF6776 family protein n=1 Tax=Pseudomaricurvus alcaniphilus TaxID=1166482 RepID=UPI001A9CD0CB|nr:DUF6776 family protein [Pseudomaricurvus alcaniphilus]
MLKGSKDCQMVVVPYRPWRARVLIALGVLLLILGTAGSYWYGVKFGRADQLGAALERDSLVLKLQAADQELANLRQQVANLQLGAEVDQRASETVRAEVIELKSEVAALEEDISFYRSLMSPSENSSGLTIGSLSLVAVGQPGVYDYKLVVQQLAARHSLLKGTLNFNIVGRQAEQLVTLPLKDMADNVEEEDIKLRFKYFQTIAGRLTIPDGFEPERIELVASSTGSNAVVVKKNFGWLVEER